MSFAVLASTQSQNTYRSVYFAPTIAKKLLIISVISVICVLNVIYTSRLKEGFISWKKALTLYTNATYGISAGNFASVYPLFNTNGEFLMQYGKALNMAGSHEEAIKTLSLAEIYLNNTVVQTTLGDSYKALGKYTQSEQSYTQAIQMTPGKIYPYYLLANLYKESGRGKEAVQIARKALDLPVKVPSTANNEIRTEITSLISDYYAK